LVIIGPDTGSLSNWGTTPALNAILESRKPVLGLGEGGYAFFGKVKLAIGWPNGAMSQGDALYGSNPQDPFWSVPYDITFGNEPIRLYQKQAPSRVIYFPQVPSDVIVFGYDENHPLYANIAQELNKYMLWGFGGGPSLMTDAGRRLFANTVLRSFR
jgi:hypothetical protein